MKLALAALVLAAPFSQEPELPTHAIDVGEEELASFAFGPKGKQLFTAHEGAFLKSWSLKKDELLWSQPDGAIPARWIDVDGDGMVFTAYGAPYFNRYDPKTGESDGGVGGPTPTVGVTGIAADPKGRWAWLAMAGGGYQRLTPGNVNGWSKRGLENGRSTCIAASDKLVAIGGEDGAVWTAKASNADPEKELLGHEGPVNAVAFGPKGKLLVSGGEDRTVRVWSASKGKLQHTLEGHGAPVRFVAVDPKAKLVASVDADGTIRVWSAKEGEVVATLSAGGEPKGLEFRPGAAALAVGVGTTITIWDLSEL